MAMEVNTDALRKQVMVSQFVNAVGCSPDEATQMLISARWQLEVQLQARIVATLLFSPLVR